MKLRDLFTKIPDLLSIEEHPRLNAEVTGISTNSHACKSGDIFIGMPGTRVDGGEFWQSAIDSGAIAAIISREAAKNTHQQQQIVLLLLQIRSLYVLQYQQLSPIIQRKN